MPQLRFPKRDTEGLPSVFVDNDNGTNVELGAGNTFSVSYATSKYVYAIIVFSYYFTNPGEALLEVTEDGSTYYQVPAYITNTNMFYAHNHPYWWVNKSIKGWRLRNNSSIGRTIAEIIVLTPDNTKPYLEVYYPNTVEIINSGTNNLDSFANLSNISDGDDNTYASFTFRSGYSTYTLYLKGEISLPMVSLISPFALIEIDPDSSNLASAINSEKSHGYFHWGAKDHTLDYVTSSIPYGSYIPSISNSPKKLWSQKVYETTDASGVYIRGVFNNSALSPLNYVHAPPTERGVNRSALLEALQVSTVVGNKRLYVPYFFSFPHRPIFVTDTYHIYHATNDIVEPFVYTAANGSTGKIYLYFGLRIETTSLVTSNFTVKIYGLGFLCFPQMDLEVPLSLPSRAVWFEHTPLGSVTRDNNESTESPDITTDEKFVSIYPAAVDVSSGWAIRYRIRSTSGGTSTFNVDRYYGFHRASDDNILWYYKRDLYSVGNTLQSFDVTGADQHGQTKVIKVEIKPI